MTDFMKNLLILLKYNYWQLFLITYYQLLTIEKLKI